MYSPQVGQELSLPAPGHLVRPFQVSSSGTAVWANTAHVYILALVLSLSGITQSTPNECAHAYMGAEAFGRGPSPHPCRSLTVQTTHTITSQGYIIYNKRNKLKGTLWP